MSSEYDRAELFLEKRAAPRRASVLRHAVRNADKVDRKLSPSSLSIVGSIRASGRQPVDCGGQERTDGQTDGSGSGTGTDAVVAVECDDSDSSN